MRPVNVLTGEYRRYQSFATVIDGEKGETSTLKSLTKEGKTMSLQEIIKRDQIQLLSPASNVQEFYDDTFIVPDFNRMDLVEIDLYKEHIEKQWQNLKNEIKNEKSRREAEAKQKADEEAAKATQQAKDDLEKVYGKVGPTGSV